MLKEGLTVSLLDGITPNSVSLHPGTVGLQGKQFQGVDYTAIPAFRPKNDVRPLSKRDARVLLDSSPLVVSPNERVYLYRLPAPVWTEIRQQLNLPAAQADYRLQDIVGSKEYLSAVATMMAYVERRFLLTGEGLVLNRIGSNPANLLIVSYNREQAYYPGLHIDTWDKLPINGCERARNRLCLNVGHQSRYFLFINLSIRAMTERLGLEYANIQQTENVKSLTRRFCTRFPDYPVVRLELRPGEGYIAPTENLVHDGSTLGTTSPDYYFTMRGYFAPAVI